MPVQQEQKALNFIHQHEFILVSDECFTFYTKSLENARHSKLPHLILTWWLHTLKRIIWGIMQHPGPDDEAQPDLQITIE